MTEGNGFLKGALIGGVLAGIAGLLLAPKSGALLVKDILDIYDSAQKNGHDFIEAIKEKGSCLTQWGEEEQQCNHHYPLLIGGALGAIIGGVAALLLASDSGNKLKKALGNQYDDIRGKAEDFISLVEKKGSHALDEVNDWKETLTELISKLSHITKGKHNYHSKIDEILNLARVGIHLYQQFQNRR